MIKLFYYYNFIYKFNMKTFLSFVFILCSYCAITNATCEGELCSQIVTVEQGKLRGKIAVDANGNNFLSFQGIPYAKPPINKLRFKSPLPADSWTYVRNATKEGNKCLAIDFLIEENVGNEDCLYLNVYTPEIANEKPLKPVMFFIHGGGFIEGSGNTDFFGPEYLMTEDVVLVTINYRLGILGFLSLDDVSLEVPGNAGLKDIVLALKWVQHNIKEFNGDPNRVTIFGQSAGSAACHYLIMSKSANGLFHQAILQSGVALNQWAISTRNAFEIAELFSNETITNEKQALNILKDLPADKFYEAQDLLPDRSLINETKPYGPVIETPNSDAIIIKHPIEIMQSGEYNHVPIMIGYNSREGMLQEFVLESNRANIQYVPDDFQTEIPSYYNIPINSSVSKIVAQKIKDFYYNHNSNGTNDDIDTYYILCSDTYFIRGIFQTIKSLLKTLEFPIYLYRFDVESSLNWFKNISNITKPGVPHGDELFYLFKSDVTPQIKPNSIEDVTIRRMIKLWTNFAKTGTPTPKTNDSLINTEWLKVTHDKIQSFLIDNAGVKMEHNPDEIRMKFWDKISQIYGNGYGYKM